MKDNANIWQTHPHPIGNWGGGIEFKGVGRNLGHGQLERVKQTHIARNFLTSLAESAVATG
jgi:hypothetical protein